MNYCLKTCFHHLLWHLLKEPAGGAYLPSEPAPLLRKQPVAARFTSTIHQVKGQQVYGVQCYGLKSSRVATRRQRPVRVYVQRVPNGSRAAYAARASGYVRAAAAFLLDDDVCWLYAYLLGW